MKCYFIGRPYKKTNSVGRVALNPPIAECNGAITVVHRSIEILLTINLFNMWKSIDFQFVFDKSAAPGQAALQQLHIPRTDCQWQPLRRETYNCALCILHCALSRQVLICRFRFIYFIYIKSIYTLF